VIFAAWFCEGGVAIFARVIKFGALHLWLMRPT